jgi:acyl carrier protein
MNIFKKIFSVEKERMIYQSIKKLPISIWWEINYEGKFDKLVLEGSFSDAELYNSYLIMLQEYYDNFGVSEEYEEFIKAKLKYTEKLADYIITQSNEAKMFLEMAKIEMNELTPKEKVEKEQNELFEYITNIEKNFGFQINEEELTTYKFYAYQKSLRNG